MKTGLADRPLFHLTHVDNLASIVRDKQIFADTNSEWDERPAVDISPASLRADRRSASSGIPGRTVSDFVPFSVFPGSAALELVGDRSDFVVLVTGVRTLVRWQRDFPKDHRPQFLYYDRNPTEPDARFGCTREDLQSLIGYLERTPGRSPAEIEFLVLDRFPFRLVTSLAVPSAAGLSRVQGLVADRLEPMATSIKPQWFGAALSGRPQPPRREPRFE